MPEPKYNLPSLRHSQPLPRRTRFHTDCRHRRGLAHRDLLLVLSLVAIVAALFAPTFRRWQTRRADRGCIENLRRIGAATALYLEDYDETLPFAWNNGSPNDANSYFCWFDVLGPYMNLPKAGPRKGKPHKVDNASALLRCPTDAQGPNPVSYALNALVAGAHFDAKTFPPERLSGIVRPAQIVWAGDTNKNWSRAEGFYDTYTDWVRPEIDLGYPKTDDRALRFYRRWLKERDWTDLQAHTFDCPDGLYRCKYPAFRHNRTGAKTGTASFLFLDGHVRACRWGTLNIENFFPNSTAQQIAQFNY